MSDRREIRFWLHRDGEHALGSSCLVRQNVGSLPLRRTPSPVDPGRHMPQRQRTLFELEAEPWERDAESDIVLASVVFPEAPPGEFDYHVPDPLRQVLRPGARVIVPLGRGNQPRVAYCIRLKTGAGPGRPFKPIQKVLDDPPLILPQVLELATWISEYYLCTLGAVLECVVPSGVRRRAGTKREIVLRVADHVPARLGDLKLPPAQERALSLLLHSPHAMTPHALARQAGCGEGTIQALRKKQLVLAERRLIFPGASDDAPARREKSSPLVLNEDQRRALDVIQQALAEGGHSSILLHGITGSGKTEVYLQAIEETVRYGRQAIVLVPEISLTPQARQRFEARLNRVAVLHSHLPPATRHAQWQRIARGDVDVVLGARSAIFAPVQQLGLIVIDEEHESTFKQEVAPRYHARDVAMRRAQLAGIPLVLGSATPSLESWQQAEEGRMRRVRLPRRVQDLPLPEVRIVDLRMESLDRGFRGAISRPLHRAMHQALADGGQIILLLNRRGYSTHIQCPRCGHVVRCHQCDIALTHHRQGERALCHYCDFQMPTPQTCPACNFSGIRFGGLGTQRLEVEVRARFPEATVARVDTDTMRKSGSHEAVFDQFQRGDVRILLGTQMIAKGLDFPQVTLVGVVQADTALHLPDFRAGEKTFQLITQVAGRTGRGPRGGRVIVQTYCPDHFVIAAAARHDYEAFAARELPLRREFLYPPFASLMRLIFRGAQEPEVGHAAQTLASRLRAESQARGISLRLLGPSVAPIARIRNQYRVHLILQCHDAEAVRTLLRDCTRRFQTPPDVQWIIDVDAVSLL